MSAPAIQHNYVPFVPFRQFHARTKRFAVMVCTRRAGKTVAVVNDMVVRALRTQKKGARYGYFAPNMKQGVRAAWDYFQEAVANIPGVVVKESSKTIDLPNGARIELYSAEDPQSIRGGKWDGAVLDEYGDMKSVMWTQVVRAGIADRQGWVVFIGTPRGKNNFYELRERARVTEKDRWFYLSVTAEDIIANGGPDTGWGVWTRNELDDVKLDAADEDEFQQEYMCSFEASNRGTYYGKHLQEVDRRGQIRVDDPRHPFYTQVASPSAVGQFSTVDNAGNAVNINSFTDVIQHQQRLWFVSTNSTIAYYTNIAQPTGSLFEFDFGSFFPRGGKLQHLASWSMNMGSVNGVQANLIAFSDRGDCVIFVGNNPAVAANWSLSGTYPLAAPVGKRCTIPFTSDLLYLSRDGLVPLSTYIQTDTLNSTVAITNKIGPTVSDLINSFGTQPGFELAIYPGADSLILNIPQSSTANNFQFNYNTITQGWTQFTNWAASTWGLFNNALYFGTTGKVCLAFIGYADGADINGNGGNNIIATALSAFTYFDDAIGRGVLKHVHQVKPYIVTGAVNPVIRVGVNTDFNLVPIIGSATVNPITGAVWDNAIWDNSGATWVGSLTTYNQWTTPLCYDGDAIAFAMSISATAQTLWTSTGWIVEPGGQWG